MEDIIPMLESHATLAGLGAGLIVLFLWFIRTVLRSSAKQFNNQNTLDERTLAIVNLQQTNYQKQYDSQEKIYERAIKSNEETITALRDRTEKYQNELALAYDRITKIQEGHQQIIRDTVSLLELRHKEDINLLNKRIDAAEQKHRECDIKMSKQEGMLDVQAKEIFNLRQMISSQPSFNVQSGATLQVGPATKTKAV